MRPELLDLAKLGHVDSLSIYVDAQVGLKTKAGSDVVRVRYSDDGQHLFSLGNHDAFPLPRGKYENGSTPFKLGRF